MTIAPAFNISGVISIAGLSSITHTPIHMVRQPDSSRFLEFDGVGPKIASMAANTLARDFKIPFADCYSIDISADVHVRRVFGRLGLCAADATIEQLVYKARALHPAFPGIMDLPSWEIGRNWCKPRTPLCGSCYMKDLCVAANS